MSVSPTFSDNEPPFGPPLLAKDDEEEPPLRPFLSDDRCFDSSIDDSNAACFELVLSAFI
jgi:hypothetical protein